ncbi:MAG: type II toxin-antitoxin system RelB/DinJ family antitoxin [Gammaproteobacteria bacterium]|nr:type II toxin-antitoxin system RelB/DinJ family antitoxin [Gammaproteobacteria bacterium]
MTDTVIRAKVDPDLKEAFYAFCKERDITPSQAIRAYMRNVVKIPNNETLATLKRSEAGEDIHKAKNAEDLFDQLGI